MEKRFNGLSETERAELRAGRKGLRRRGNGQEGVAVEPAAIPVEGEPAPGVQVRDTGIQMNKAEEMAPKQADPLMSPESIQGIIAAAVTAAVQAANKPKEKTEQELAEIEMSQQQRKEMAESLKKAKTNARYFAKHICSHEHNRRDGGGTHCVYVKDNDHLGDPGYIYCQECCGRFRPDDLKWRKLDPDAIFDTARFNLLFQHCAQSQGDIIG